MKVIKEKLIGTYIRSIDEAAVKEYKQGYIYFSPTTEFNENKNVEFVHESAKIEIFCDNELYREKGEYLLKTPVRIGDIQEGTTGEGVPFITFIDENGKRIFKMIFEVLNADDKYYFHSFCIINNEPPDLKYDCITDDPTQKATYIRCKDCGELFSLFRHEVEWFKKQNLHTPKRCKSCRNKRQRSAYNG